MPGGEFFPDSNPHPVGGPNFSGLSVEQNQTFGSIIDKVIHLLSEDEIG